MIPDYRRDHQDPYQPHPPSSSLSLYYLYSHHQELHSQIYLDIVVERREISRNRKVLRKVHLPLMHFGMVVGGM
jgi:hypothetical protein